MVKRATHRARYHLLWGLAAAGVIAADLGVAVAHHSCRARPEPNWGGS